MEYKEFKACHDVLKLRKNLTIEIPENAIGIKYKPEDLELGVVDSDTEVTHVRFVFSKEETEVTE